MRRVKCAAGAGDGGETGPDGFHVKLTLCTCAEKGLDRGECHHRVVRLVFAMQRQVDVGVHPAEPLQLQHLATDRDLAAQNRELGILPGNRGVGASIEHERALLRMLYGAGWSRWGWPAAVGGLGGQPLASQP